MNIYKLKKNNYIFFAVCIMMFALFIGCSKEQPYQPNGNDDIALEDGRLVFKNQQVFEDHLNWIFENQGNPELIINKNTELGFVSMKSIYEKGLDMMNEIEAFMEYMEEHSRVFEAVIYEDNSTLYELEAPPIFAYLANCDGLYQVGEKIFRVSYYNTYELANSDASILSQLFLESNRITDKNIKVIPTYVQSKSAQYYYRNDYFESRHRLCSRHYESLVAGLWCYRVRSTAQKKRLGIWIRETIDYVEVSWADGNYYQENDPNQHSISSAIHTGTKDVDIVLQYTEYPIVFSTSYCLATHKGTRDDSSGPDEVTREDDCLEDL